MIDCRKCHHWDSFEWHAVIWHRLTDGFMDEPITERVETCGKGLSGVEDGRTVGYEMVMCDGYLRWRQGDLFAPDRPGDAYDQVSLDYDQARG